MAPISWRTRKRGNRGEQIGQCLVRPERFRFCFLQHCHVTDDFFRQGSSSIGEVGDGREKARRIGGLSWFSGAGDGRSTTPWPGIVI